MLGRPVHLDFEDRGGGGGGGGKGKGDGKGKGGKSNSVCFSFQKGECTYGNTPLAFHASRTTFAHLLFAPGCCYWISIVLI